jgi:hypothetical protein
MSPDLRVSGDRVESVAVVEQQAVGEGQLDRGGRPVLEAVGRLGNPEPALDLDGAVAGGEQSDRPGQRVSTCMAGVGDGDIAALADGELSPDRQAQVEAAVAVSPELARKLAVQLRVVSTVRAAAARVWAPGRLRGNPDAAPRP